MKEYPIRYVTLPLPLDSIPLQIYTIGSNHQKAIHRPKGFSATQVLITLSGRGRICTTGKSDQVLKKQEAYIIYEGVSHEYFPVTDEPWIVCFISFRGATVKTMLTNMDFKDGEILLINDLEQLLELFGKIWMLSGDKGTHEQIWGISGLLYLFLLELRKQTTNFPYQTPKVINPSPGKTALDHVTTFLREHYKQPILLSEVSNSSGYSQQHLNRLFRQFYGVTLNQYLQNLRILHAVDQIERNRNIKFSEIAEEIGIETKYFTRLFKKNMGMSPREYRRLTHHY